MLTITDILKVHEGNADRAVSALFQLDSLPAEDLARPDFRAAAQTFGLLAVADALTDGPSGAPLGQTARDIFHHTITGEGS